MAAGDAAATARLRRLLPTGCASTSAPTTPCSAAVDAVVFTAGVGEHAPGCGPPSLAGLGRLGIEIDRGPQRREIGLPRPGSPRTARDVAVLVVPTNEEFEIARQALEVVAR